MYAQPEIPHGTPRPGDLFAGRYKIESVLGVGGMGVVLGARGLADGSRVALKVLSPTAARDEERVQRFLREGRAVSRIGSRHVGRVFDVSTAEDGLPYIVMEYLDGCDLATLLGTRGPLQVPFAVDLLLQACEALSEAHAAGIVHRDLKPSNLFVTMHPDGQPLVKVLDFGISKIEEGEPGSGDFAMTQTRAIFGSPLYMSPEQLRSARDVDAKADVWSLGVILYEVLTGVPPFLGETLPELSASILREPAPKLRGRRPDAPPGLEALIRRCLEKDPARRVQSVTHFAVAAAAFASPGGRWTAEQIVKSGRWVPAAGSPVLVPLPLGASASTVDNVFGPMPSDRKWLRLASVGGLIVALGGLAFGLGLVRASAIARGALVSAPTANAASVAPAPETPRAPLGVVPAAASASSPPSAPSPPSVESAAAIAPSAAATRTENTPTDAGALLPTAAPAATTTNPSTPRAPTQPPHTTPHPRVSGIAQDRHG